MMCECRWRRLLATKYLRAGGVVCTTLKMRNKNKHPVTIKVDLTNPLEHDWDNFAEILWEFAVHYLASEGLEWTSNETRSILLYIFHGKYLVPRSTRGKKVYILKPLIHAIHFNLIAHRSRFVTGVSMHFQQLDKLLDKHPTWERFLDDKGVGVAPRLFLVAVEAGIRSFARAPNAKMTMGVGVNKVVDKTFYANIADWWKTECYITAVRSRRGKTSYRKWEDFSWSDFVERSKLAQTFIKRHLPLCDGEDHFGGELKNPPLWDGASSIKKPSRKSKTKKVKTETRVGPSLPMQFDPTTGSLVSFIDLS